jgi:hypothetical protein
VNAQQEPARKVFPLLLGVVTLADVVVLLAQDAEPRWFASIPHGVAAAFSLALIAVAYLIFQGTRRPGFAEWTKAVLLAAAFLFWAANQYWPNLPQAGLFNDIAIALFVLDVVFAIAGWPSTSGDVVQD